MSSTIDRSLIVPQNDSGSSSAPAGDGSILQASFFNSIYNAIDALFNLNPIVFGGSLRTEGKGVQVKGSTAPPLSPGGEGWIYFDSGLGYFLKSENGGAYTSLSPFILLHQGAGNNQSAAPLVVDQIAFMNSTLTGFTTKDGIKVVLTVTALSAAVSSLWLYSVTDGLAIANIVSGSLAAGSSVISEITILPDATNSTKYNALVTGFTTGAQALSTGQQTAMSTDFTNNWTLGLKHGGVAAGGTLSYRWIVYKLAGA